MRRTVDLSTINLNLNTAYNAHFITQIERLRRRLGVTFRLFVELLRSNGAQISTTTLHAALVSGIPIREWPSLLAALTLLSRQFGTPEDKPAHFLHSPIFELVWERNRLRYLPESASLSPQRYLIACMSWGGLDKWTLSAEIERRGFGAISPRTIHRWINSDQPIGRGITILPILGQIFRLPISRLIPNDFERSFAICDSRYPTADTRKGGLNE